MTREFRPMSIHETYRPPRLTPRGKAVLTALAAAGWVFLIWMFHDLGPFVWVRNP